MSSAFLLSDSRLLFSPAGVARLLRPTLHELSGSKSPTGVFVGAASGDQPEYYSIFLAAMEQLGVGECHMISSSYHEIDRSRLNEADIIVLGGGDVGSGWRVLQDIGMARDIRDRFAENVTLIGVSAGAVHMGLKAWSRAGTTLQIVDTLGLVPFIVDVHDEAGRWKRLRQLLRDTGLRVNGLALPIGGGVVVHDDTTVEPLGQPVVEFLLDEAGLRETLLVPHDQGLGRETRS